ncbi:putative interactor of constitutively active ROPs [Helianthus annuus]|uniref:Interactor of constitutive active ROPs n=2 Tax=Helianthus annuus TaxID=4232 RepID=A0A9K3IMM2_HELAN|nr:interactor of constitutive active ROPs 2, chloroplastic isoform X2 [Helianthus annuus]XP_021973204.1 interactor of constitutive active ROPs 2, chloroplastic isoform X2 [Helianthus annuus]XP_021973205.1 interactor of constitutive active ROPs 2, chloroplastic isoform X2 [Helianthus annuus]XP_021973206.1 interactor of constitutive active ROPs 2, chloroplastic isoform X2 [Helianthus annuus]KAF5799291.1 putative interactor of constitutive active ROPs [Helianthus annuus]KAJ0557570.1 putative inte
MQTPKTRAGTLEVPQRTPKTARQLKTSGTEADNSSSQSPLNKTPKARSPKVDRRSPRTPTSEKKRPGRVSELETQLANLQEELKKTKDQLNQSELCKKRAHEEAEEVKRQLIEVSEKLQDSQRQLDEISASEESRLQELRNISQDRDRAWESELEAVQKHHSVDSAALAAANNEVQKLKIELEKVADSEAEQAKYAESAHNEMVKLRKELSETLAVIEELKTQLKDSQDSEARALETVSQTREQLETVKSTEETLRLEKAKAMEAYDSLTVELEKSKAQVDSLEETVSKLQVNDGNTDRNDDDDKEELNRVKTEVEKLRLELEGAEKRYQGEYIQSTLLIFSAHELVEQTRTESCEKVSILEANLEKSKAELEDLTAKLVEKEESVQNILEENKHLIEKLEKTELTAVKDTEQARTESFEQVSILEANLEKSKAEVEDLNAKLAEKEERLLNVSEENKHLNEKLEKTELTTVKDTEDATNLKKLEADLEDMKRVMFEKEAELKNITEENERLKMENSQVNNEAVASAEAARTAEKEARMKVEYLTEEADKSGKKVVRVTEQLDLAQAANAEMETELRRLKVQSDQWRKAAEAAANMLSGGNNGKFMERTGSLDSHTIGGKLNSPLSEDMEDESPKKKNGNMLKKIGVLLKKGQK